jgi:hypothetical protein
MIYQPLQSIESTLDDLCNHSSYSRLKKVHYTEISQPELWVVSQWGARGMGEWVYEANAWARMTHSHSFDRLPVHDNWPSQWGAGFVVPVLEGIKKYLYLYICKQLNEWAIGNLQEGHLDSWWGFLSQSISCCRFAKKSLNWKSYIISL